MMQNCDKKGIYNKTHYVWGNKLPEPYKFYTSAAVDDCDIMIGGTGVVFQIDKQEKTCLSWSASVVE